MIVFTMFVGVVYLFGKEQFGVLKKELWSARGGKKKD